MKWFKFYGQDYLSDPKMLSLSPAERSCWITLLCYSSVNDNGMITFMNEEQLMSQAGLSATDDDWDRTVGVLKKLEKLKMIHNDNGEITVLNWKKRQETSLTGYERIKRYREKVKNDNADDNTKITLDKIRVDKIRVEGENTPSQTTKDFLSKGKYYQEYLDLFSKDSKVELIQKEFDKFILYWTEPNGSGTKQRWQQQPTFDVKRRLVTWLGKLNSFNRPIKQRIVL